MGDGLLRNQHFDLARQLYSVALKRASPHRRQAARVRLGLALAPTARTLMLLRLVEELEAGSAPLAFVSEGMATWLKTLPFADDARFQELAETHADLLPIANWHWNLQTALWAVQATRDVPGDFVELGVFKGHTTLFCADYVGFQEWPKQWWLYDTFEGIPDDQVAPGWERVNQKLYTDKFSFEEVRDRFARFPNIKVIKGRVPEILQEGAPERIAFMHIDLNNAPAEIGALETLFDRVSPGGVILFDDYCWASARAQYDAENAWFAARGLQILPIPTGQGVFVKR
jgi:hypothetical protein